MIPARRQSPRGVACACGRVQLEVVGKPMTSAVCYCDTCQEGSRRLEALPNAAPARDPDGGTGYVLYRTDRVRVADGANLLRTLRVSDESATLRVYASCCNAAMVMRFDDARHWVCVYRARFRDDLPALQFRICTKFRSADVPIPNDVPAFRMYPPRFMLKLATSKLAMLLRVP